MIFAVHIAKSSDYYYYYYYYTHSHSGFINPRSTLSVPVRLDICKCINEILII